MRERSESIGLMLLLVRVDTETLECLRPGFGVAL